MSPHTYHPVHSLRTIWKPSNWISAHVLLRPDVLKYLSSYRNFCPGGRRQWISSFSSSLTFSRNCSGQYWSIPWCFPYHHISVFSPWVFFSRCCFATSAFEGCHVGWCGEIRIYYGTWLCSLCVHYVSLRIYFHVCFFFFLVHVSDPHKSIDHT